MRKKKALIVDVRSPSEFNLGNIDGPINIPYDTIRQNLDKLPKEKETPILAYCNVGHTAYLFIKVLVSHGYTNLFTVCGGYLILTS
jgi:rhodanese-related sulfurtransferase